MRKNQRCAVALGAEPFSQPVGPGELELPAIRGVGGGLIYLIDSATELGRIWDVDFQPVSPYVVMFNKVSQVAMQSNVKDFTVGPIYDLVQYRSVKKN